MSAAVGDGDLLIQLGQIGPGGSRVAVTGACIVQCIQEQHQTVLGIAVGNGLGGSLGVVLLLVPSCVLCDLSGSQGILIDTDTADITGEITVGNCIHSCAQNHLAGTLRGPGAALRHEAAQIDSLAGSGQGLHIAQAAILIPLLVAAVIEHQSVGHAVDGAVISHCILLRRSHRSPAGGTIAGTELQGRRILVGKDNEAVVGGVTGILLTAVGLEGGDEVIVTGDAHNVADFAVIHGGEVVQNELDRELRACQCLTDRVGQQDIVVVEGQIMGVIGIVGTPGLTVHFNQFACAGQILPRGGIGIKAGAGILVGIQIQHQILGDIAGSGCGSNTVILLGIHAGVLNDLSGGQGVGIHTDSLHIALEMTAGHHVGGGAEGNLRLIGGLPGAVLQITVHRHLRAGLAVGAAGHQHTVLIPLVAGGGAEVQRVGSAVQFLVANRGIVVDQRPAAGTHAGAEVVAGAGIGPNHEVVVDNSACVLGAAIGLELGNVGVSAGHAHNVVDAGAAVHKAVHHELNGELSACQCLTHGVGQQDVVFIKAQIVSAGGRLGTPSLTVDLDQLAAGGKVLPGSCVGVESGAGIVVGIQMQHQIVGHISGVSCCGELDCPCGEETENQHQAQEQRKHSARPMVLFHLQILLKL